MTDPGTMEAMAQFKETAKVLDAALREIDARLSAAHMHQCAGWDCAKCGPMAASSIQELIRGAREKAGAVAPEVESYIPTENARFCNQAGPMGGGCKDSWHVGGNYGSHVCRNPNHHDPSAEGRSSFCDQRHPEHGWPCEQRGEHTVHSFDPDGHGEVTWTDSEGTVEGVHYTVDPETGVRIAIPGANATPPRNLNKSTRERHAQ